MDDRRQQETLDYYCGNNMARLRQIAYPIFTRFGGISPKDYDEFYSEANRTVWSAAASFDDSRGEEFEAFLKSCLSRKFKSLMTNRNRVKRVADRMCVSLDAPVEEEGGATLGDLILSPFDLETELLIETGTPSGSRMEQYLERLSRRQREIAALLSEGYKPSEIREQLRLSDKEYSNHMAMLRSYENVSVLF